MPLGPPQPFQWICFSQQRPCPSWVPCGLGSKRGPSAELLHPPPGSHQPRADGAGVKQSLSLFSSLSSMQGASWTNSQTAWQENIQFVCSQPPQTSPPVAVAAQYPSPKAPSCMRAAAHTGRPSATSRMCSRREHIGVYALYSPTSL